MQLCSQTVLLCRFTGSPALYLECDIHMCHNRCPVRESAHLFPVDLTESLLDSQPQRCYWRTLSKRSADIRELDEKINSTAKPVVSESISLYQALEVYHEQDENKAAKSTKGMTAFEAIMYHPLTDDDFFKQPN